MRQYLNLALVMLAGVFVIAGCTTVDQAAMERSLYVDEHPELPEMTAEAILNGQIMVGMTEEMVATTWGKPVRVEPANEGGVKTRWIYGNYFVAGSITSLYFTEDGLLVSYEVTDEPAHANNASLSDDTTASETGSPSGGSKSQGGAGQP